MNNLNPLTQIVITIDCQSQAWQPMDCLDLVAPLLQCEQLAFHVEGGRVNFRKLNARAYDALGQGQVVVTVGSLPRILQALRGTGRTIEIRDRCDLDREGLQLALLGFPEEETGFPGFTTCIAQHHEGNLAFPRGRLRMIHPNQPISGQNYLTPGSSKSF